MVYTPSYFDLLENVSFIGKPLLLPNALFDVEGGYTKISSHFEGVIHESLQY